LGDLVAVFVIWLVAGGLAEWATVSWVNSGPWDSGPYFYVASNLGTVGLHAFDFLLEFAVAIFMLVVVMIAYSAVRFRVRRGERPSQAPSQSRYNGTFVGVWIVGSIVLNLLFWIHPTASGLEAVYAAQLPQNNKNALIVDVAARQWEWIFSYPQYGIQQAVNNQGFDALWLPVNRPVEFILKSYDPAHNYENIDYVIHSFWIPAFGVKEDVVPGQTRYLYLIPTHITSTKTNEMVRVQCAEVCGGGHPYMEADVHVVTPQAFAAWVQHQKHLQNSILNLEGIVGDES
jgi:cytochrome c oxidase subunit 2